MENNNDPLLTLVSKDTQSTDKHKLSQLLKPFISIEQDSHELGFLEPFSNIPRNMPKIELVLAAAKARALLFKVPDGLLTGEIVAQGIMPEGSVKSSLKRLCADHKIKKDKESRYSIPAYRIPELIKQFTKK